MSGPYVSRSSERWKREDCSTRRSTGIFPLAPVPQAFKPLIYEIAAGVVRWKLYLDWVLSHLVKEGIKKEVRHLLWMSLYQAFFMKKAVYHVVNEAVDYAKKERGQRTASFVNAVLRRAIRERNELRMPDDPVSRLSISHSFPSWLVRRWCARFGAQGTEGSSISSTRVRSLP